MRELSIQEMTVLYYNFFKTNYDMIFLKTMTDLACKALDGSTLITGSSHALNAIYEPAWGKAYNCSMHSQDIYYDFLCAKKAIENGGKFKRCFITMGYYIAYQDLSKSILMRETMVSRVYNPVFGDTHYWENPTIYNPWGFLDMEVDEKILKICENESYSLMAELGTYYTQYRPRTSFFNFNGRKWAEITEAEKDYAGKIRAESHNKLVKYKDTLEDNKKTFNEFIKYLYKHDIVPILVVTPFTPEYNKYVNLEMKQGMYDLADSSEQDVHFVDFNDNMELFDADDFMDTDHLSEKGGKKVSEFLVEMYGR